MPTFVILHRPPDDTAKFEMYVTSTPTAPEALAAVLRAFKLEGNVEVNGRPLTEKDASALALTPGEVRKL